MRFSRNSVVLGLACAIALAAQAASDDQPKAPLARAARHPAFQRLRAPAVPSLPDSAQVRTPIDAFVLTRLQRDGLSLGVEAERSRLIRRVAFLLTGLPPTAEEIDAFVRDAAPDAYERMIERFLGSHHYGEAWGKQWLDAAGYADSNGYFSADTDRPLAYRYRDYVIRSLNRDTPFDHFVRQQLAGDELSGWASGQPASAEIIELLEATHFLRNGQDGSGESDGNPDEVRVDRYYALESAVQIIGSCLLGLTVQCAKCHDHKFEPLSQQDYYALQSVFYPAFNVDQWVKPNDRVVEAPLPGELRAWQAKEKRLDEEQANAQRELARWIETHRPAGTLLFRDTFDGSEPLTNRWSNVAPGDDAPGGSPAVMLDSETAPAAAQKDGALRVLEGGGPGDRWISTREIFPWPASTGGWIQATFDLVALQVKGQGKAAERVGYFIALHDFNDNSPTSGGNILIDGNPGGKTSVHVDYPGADSAGRGNVGGTGYQAGRNYGVRVRNLGDGSLTLQHLVDGAPDGAPLQMKVGDVVAGGFGFEYCCGRGFIVDNVVIEASRQDDPAWTDALARFEQELKEKRDTFEKRLKSVAQQRSPRPGKIAWVTDTRAEPPVVRLLKRGNPKTPGDAVEPAPPAFLAGDRPGLDVSACKGTTPTTGRRLAWAHWLTEPGSPQAALLARVTVNRVWQRYFGAGLVATSDNLGLSGAAPTHPDLLEWLAAYFVESGWSLKALQRVILRSAVVRQSSAPRAEGLAQDPANQRLWRYPLRRLDAEAIRDAMLAVGGRLGPKSSGPYVPTTRSGAGEVLVDESRPEGLSRSVFLQQRRTQVPTFLGMFDAPSLVFNCTRRAETTMALQSLSLLNSEFATQRAHDLARRLEQECGNDPAAKLRRAFLLVAGRVPDAEARRLCATFLAAQRDGYAATPEPERSAWVDLCQMLLASNSFLYLE